MNARRGGRLLKGTDGGGRDKFGSSEMAVERSLPQTACTGLSADVQSSSVDLPSLEAWESTKASITVSRLLLGVARRVDRKAQKRSGVNPLKLCEFWLV